MQRVTCDGRARSTTRDHAAARRRRARGRRRARCTRARNLPFGCVPWCRQGFVLLRPATCLAPALLGVLLVGPRAVRGPPGYAPLVSRANERKQAEVAHSTATAQSAASRSGWRGCGPMPSGRGVALGRPFETSCEHVHAVKPPVAPVMSSALTSRAAAIFVHFPTSGWRLDWATPANSWC